MRSSSYFFCLSSIFFSWRISCMVISRPRKSSLQKKAKRCNILIKEADWRRSLACTSHCYRGNVFLFSTFPHFSRVSEKHGKSQVKSSHCLKLYLCFRLVGWLVGYNCSENSCTVLHSSISNQSIHTALTINQEQNCAFSRHKRPLQVFSRPWPRLHIFRRLSSVACLCYRASADWLFAFIALWLARCGFTLHHFTTVIITETV